MMTINNSLALPSSSLCKPNSSDAKEDYPLAFVLEIIGDSLDHKIVAKLALASKKWQELEPIKKRCFELRSSTTLSLFRIFLNQDQHDIFHKYSSVILLDPKNGIYCFKQFQENIFHYCRIPNGVTRSFAEPLKRSPSDIKAFMRIFEYEASLVGACSQIRINHFPTDWGKEFLSKIDNFEIQRRFEIHDCILIGDNKIVVTTRDPKLTLETLIEVLAIPPEIGHSLSKQECPFQDDSQGKRERVYQFFPLKKSAQSIPPASPKSAGVTLDDSHGSKIEDEIANQIISFKPIGEKTARFTTIYDIAHRCNPNSMIYHYESLFLNIHALDADAANLRKINEYLYRVILQRAKEKQLAAICRKASELYQTFENYLRQKEGSQKSKIFANHPTLKLLEDLVSKRIEMVDATDQESLTAEYLRLKEIPRIAKSFDTLRQDLHTFWWKSLSLQHLVAIGRTLELRESLGEDYLVINHGQHLCMMIYTLLVRELKRAFEPHQYEHFYILRHDCHLANSRFTNMTPASFAEMIKKESKTDHEFRSELIAGDIYLESQSPGESAIDFFSFNLNVALSKDGNFVDGLHEDLLNYYFPSDKTSEFIITGLRGIHEKLPLFGGVLYSICIPIGRWQEFFYCSKPFGYPTDEGKYSLEHLKIMQAGIAPLETEGFPFEKSEFFHKKKLPPQVRLLAHKLRPEEGVFVMANSTLPSSSLEAFFDELRELIDKARSLAHIL